MSRDWRSVPAGVGAAGAVPDRVLPQLAGDVLDFIWTARAAARSRVQPGQPADLAVDTSGLRFFDPSTALSIGHPG